MSHLTFTRQHLCSVINDHNNGMGKRVGGTPAKNLPEKQNLEEIIEAHSGRYISYSSNNVGHVHCAITGSKLRFLNFPSKIYMQGSAER